MTFSSSLLKPDQINQGDSPENSRFWGTSCRSFFRLDILELFLQPVSELQSYKCMPSQKTVAVIIGPWSVSCFFLIFCCVSSLTPSVSADGSSGKTMTCNRRKKRISSTQDLNHSVCTCYIDIQLCSELLPLPLVKYEQIMRWDKKKHCIVYTFDLWLK